MPSSCSRSGSIVGDAVHGPYPVASQMQLGHTQRLLHSPDSPGLG